ncbi:MAG: hypothetical protein ABEJ44_03290 [Halanaeroarchaeum sp.]
MVFENVTALELHVHTGEDTEVSTEPAPQERHVVRTTTPLATVKTVALFVAMVLVSIGISVLATFLVRRFSSRDENGETGH